MTSLIFDFDGTLCDDFHEVLTILKTLSTKFHFKKLESEDPELLRGKTARELMKELDVSLFKLPLVMTAARSELRKRLKTLKPFAGIREVLQALKVDGFKLGILTSNSQENVGDFLKANEMTDLFEFVHTGSSLFGKGRLLKSLLRERRLEASDTIYVGDEMRDIEASREAGIRVIGVSWGFNSKERLQALNPDSIVDNPSQFREAVRALITPL